MSHSTKLLPCFAAPVIQFTEPTHEIKETDGKIVIPIVRTGNTSTESTVVCYTMDDTAIADDDYLARPDSELSTVEFAPGNK